MGETTNRQSPRGPLVLDVVRLDIILGGCGAWEQRPYLASITDASTRLIVFFDLVDTKDEIPARLWAFLTERKHGRG